MHDIAKINGCQQDIALGARKVSKDIPKDPLASRGCRVTEIWRIRLSLPSKWEDRDQPLSKGLGILDMQILL
jgi:hypothetical protein